MTVVEEVLGGLVIAFLAGGGGVFVTARAMVRRTFCDLTHRELEKRGDERHKEIMRRLETIETKVEKRNATEK
jgi:hypothetical protein